MDILITMDILHQASPNTEPYCSCSLIFFKPSNIFNKDKANTDRL